MVRGVPQILTRELESVGIRLNRDPPNVFFKRKKTGGVSFSSIGPLTHLDEKMVWRILQVRYTRNMCTLDNILPKRRYQSEGLSIAVSLSIHHTLVIEQGCTSRACMWVFRK